MNIEANKAVVGAFVMGGVILLISAILLLGNRRYFEKDMTLVMFFNGSLKGLDVGGPVMFRGVRVGSVSDVRINVESDPLKIWIPVYARIEMDRLTRVGGGQARSGVLTSDKEVSVLEALIKKGLRAKLETLSLLTGKLFINLELDPEKELVLTGLDPNFPEVPTVKNELQKSVETTLGFIKDLRKLPIAELLESATRLFNGLDERFNSEESKEVIQNANTAFKGINKLVARSSKLISNESEPYKAVLRTLDDLSKASQALERRLNSPEVDSLMVSATSTLQGVNALTKEARETIAADGDLQRDLKRTLNDLSFAARSLKELTDYLEQHPEALIKGKNGGGRR